MLTGSLVAVVTPMAEDGSLDWAAFRHLIDFHIEQKTDGIVVAGTTGESPTVSMEENGALIQVAVEHAAGRIPIIAGTGANATSEAVELTRYAAQVGADYALSVVPYYNKPTQDGLYRHFRAVAESADIPVILYNVPGRTVADMSNDTVLRLAEIENVVGVKDATGDLGRGTDLTMRAPADFALYSGDDASALAFMLLGGHGVISVTANVAPLAMHQLCVAARSGQLQEARAINQRLFGLHTKLFVEANPIPVKWAVSRMGLMPEGLRLPLTPLSAPLHDTVLHAMAQAGVTVA